MPRVIVLDTLSQEGLDLLTAAADKGIEYEVRTGLKGEALRDALTQFDGAICRSGVKITAEALAGNHRLKAIVRAGVGTDKQMGYQAGEESHLAADARGGRRASATAVAQGCEAPFPPVSDAEASGKRGSAVAELVRVRPGRSLTEVSRLRLRVAHPADNQPGSAVGRSSTSLLRGRTGSQPAARAARNVAASTCEP